MSSAQANRSQPRSVSAAQLQQANNQELIQLLQNYKQHEVDATRMQERQSMFMDMGADNFWDGLMASPEFTSINDPLTQTVSPEELLMNRVPSSAPGSAMWTGLTSPMFDSPLDSFETSPLFPTDELENSDNWNSLFPETLEAIPMSNTLSNDGAFINTNAIGDDKKPMDMFVSPQMLNLGENDLGFSRSSSSSPLTSPANKARNVKPGVGPRKRSTPLAPIIIEDQPDLKAQKRARNTLAARKSRARRVERFDEMDKEIAELKEEVEHWKRLAQANGRA